MSPDRLGAQHFPHKSTGGGRERERERESERARAPKKARCAAREARNVKETKRATSSQNQCRELTGLHSRTTPVLRKTKALSSYTVQRQCT